MRLQLVMYSYRAQVTLLLLLLLFFSTLGAFAIESHHRNENVIKIIIRLATLPVYHAFQ